MNYDDRLSAYLDDELDVVEREVVEAELAASAELRAELEAVADARSVLRNLRLVDVPADFVFEPSTPILRRADSGLEVEPEHLNEPEPRSPEHDNVVSLDSRRRVRKALVRSVVAVAAAFCLLVGVGSAIPGVEVVPAIDNLVSVHSAAAATVDDAAGTDMDDMLKMGPDLGDAMPMMAATEADDYIHMVYGSSAEYVSVFRQEGRLDTDGVSTARDGVTPMEMADGSVAYQTYAGDYTVMMIESDGLVYTIISGDSMMDDAMKMTDMLPADDDGFIENALENVFGRLG